MRLSPRFAQVGWLPIRAIEVNISATTGLDMRSDIVPLASPRRDIARYEDDLIAVTRRVIGSGSYIGGPELDELEKELARSIGTEAATGVGSGTDALILAMQAAGVARGDEVIVPSHTAGPSVAAINALSAVPVFV